MIIQEERIMIMQGKRGDKVMRYNEVDGKIKKNKKKGRKKKMRHER